jgi:putative ABC transport system substrate-binding protein
MTRRAVVGLGAAAAAWPLAAAAQHGDVPVIGYLNAASAGGQRAHLLAAFLQALGEAGYVEGRNLAIEYRFAEGRYERLPAMAQDLVDRRVAVIVASPTLAARAAKAATASIPIVFVSADDPVAVGLVVSHNRPGENATGVAAVNLRLEPKRLSLLSAAVPHARTVAYLANPGSPFAESVVRDMQKIAAGAGIRLVVLTASADRDFEPAFASLLQQRADMLIVGSDPFFIGRRDRLVALAARHSVPAIYTSRESADAGGLMSYGPSLLEIHRQVGIYAGRVLKGEKPGDLPVVQPTRFEFVINLKTAKKLSLMIPDGLISAADEVIE